MNEDSTHQLRYYIALSAPPTRAACDGSEPFMRPEVGFNPSWFTEHCGVDFLEPWHKDPRLRLKTFEIMAEEVRRRFPGRNIGRADETDAAPDLLTGTYGASIFGGMFEQKIRYFNDKWPAVHDEPLDDEAADALEPVDVENSPIFQDVLRQMDTIEELTGTILGYLNWQGVLNSSFRLRGQQIFLDMALSPERAQHVFECVAVTMIRGMKVLYERQRRAGVDIRFASVGNCTVNMGGPKRYWKHLLKWDKEIREEFEAFGIHNCAWTVDPYMEAYATVPKLGYIDMGQVSDLARARELFPDARRNVLYTSMDLLNKSDEGIREDFERIARELAPCDVGLPDIEADVPDERVLLAIDLCEELSQKYG